MVTGTDEFGSIICEGYDIGRGSMLFLWNPWAYRSVLPLLVMLSLVCDA